MCRKCWARMSRHGSVETVLRYVGTHECDVDGCDERGYFRRVFGRFLCAAHNARLIRGHPAVDSPVRRYEYRRTVGAPW